MREGHATQPDNVNSTLVDAVKSFSTSGLMLPMITGPFDLLSPNHPLAKPLLSVMATIDVRLLKLG